MKTNALLLISLGILFAGCAPFPGLMKPGSDSIDAYKPAAEEASVVFLCCTGAFGGGISDGYIVIFELTPESDKLVGVVSAGKKIVYKTTPGEHMFMVLCQCRLANPLNADFMKAKLTAGKTYFSIVDSLTIPFAGRFISLKPLRKDEVDSERYGWIMEDAKFIDKSPEADGFFGDKWKKIERIDKIKKMKLEKWNRKKRHNPIRPEYGLNL